MDDLSALEVLQRLLTVCVNGHRPLWLNPGEGGSMPNRRNHDLAANKAKEGARLDFSRGPARLDYLNAVWRDLLFRLPGLVAYYRRKWGDWIDRGEDGDASVETLGNLVDIIIAICYCAMTDGHKFLHRYLDWTRGQTVVSHQHVWAGAWWALYRLGLRPSHARCPGTPSSMTVVMAYGGRVQVDGVPMQFVARIAWEHVLGLPEADRLTMGLARPLPSDSRPRSPGPAASSASLRDTGARTRVR